MAGQGPLIMVKSDISLSEPTARALALFSSWLGLVEAAPSRTDRPMTLIWHPGALMMVLDHVLGQECLIPLIIHSDTRAPELER